MKARQPRATRLEEIKLALLQCGPREGDRVVYYPSFLASLCLPAKRFHKSQYTHEVGPHRVAVMVPEDCEMPYGNYARAILSRINTEVLLNVKRQADDPRNVILGGSVAETLEFITGLNHRSGGARSPRALLERQLRSVVSASISYRYKSPFEERGGNMSFANAYEFRELWRPELLGKHSTRPKEIKLRLNEDYFTNLVQHAVPIDEGIIKHLWGSCLAIDIYIWLTYRGKSWQGKTQRLKWLDLIQQFGGGYAEGSYRSFKQKFKRAFTLVREVYDVHDPDCIRYDLRGEHNVDVTVMRPSVALSEPPGVGRSLSAPKVYQAVAGKKHKRPAAGQESLSLVAGASESGAQRSSSDPNGVLFIGEEELDRVLQLYPRREARGAALKAVQVAVEHLTKDGSRSIEQALSFLRERVEAFTASPKGQDLQFVPSPVNWFARQHYHDDPKLWHLGAEPMPAPKEPARRVSLREQLAAAGKVFGGAA